MAKDIRNTRRGYARQVGSVLPRSAKKVFREYGFAEGSMIRHWKEIAGPSISRCTLPMRLTYRKEKEKKVIILHLLVESAAALQVQHQIPLLIEKLNIFYGYSAVTRISLVQGRAGGNNKKTKEKEIPTDPAAVKKIQSWTKAMQNSGLKDALIRLGEQVLKEEQK